MTQRHHMTRRQGAHRGVTRCLLAVATALLAFSMAPAAHADTMKPLGVARLRVIDLAAFATPAQGIRVVVDGYPLANALGFGASSAYSTLTAGAHRVQIFNGMTGRAVLDASLRLLTGQDYTYLIEGQLKGTIQPVLSTDVNTPVSAGRARVRFANAIPNGVAVQARLSGGAAAFRTTSFTGLSTYHDVAAGTYTLEIMSLTGQMLLSVPNVPLGSGQVYTLFSTGLTTAAVGTAAAQAGSVVVSAATGSQIVQAAMSPATPPAQGQPMAALRLVDLVPSTTLGGTITLSVDGQTLFGAIGYGGATGYLSLPAGQHQVKVVRGTGGAVLVNGPITLAAKSSGSLVLHGVANGGIGATLSGADNTPVGATVARVRFSNMTTNGLVVRATLIGATAFPATAFNTFTPYVDVPAGQYILQVYASSGVVLATVSSVLLTGGQAYTLFSADLSGKPGAAPILAVSSTGGQFLTMPTYAAPLPAAAPIVAPQQTGAATASLRVTNLINSAVAANATFYLDGQLFTVPLGFGNSTVFATLPAGQHRLQVLAPTGQVVISTTATLQTGKAYTFAAEGMTGKMITGAILPVATTSQTAIQASVRFANAVPDSGPLLASFLNGPSLGAASFGSAGSYLSIQPGTYALQVRLSSGQGVLFVKNITVQAGKSYTIFATHPQGMAGAMGATTVILNGQ